MSVSPSPSLSDVENYWQINLAGEAEVAYLAANRKEFFDERDRQTRLLYPNLDENYGFAQAAGKLTLEVGCGMGYNSQRLAQSGARLVVLDLAQRAVLTTRERFALRGLSAWFLVADVENLPFVGGGLDMVFASGVIHHSPSTQLAAREIIRVLRVQGKATVMVYHRNSIWFWWNIVIVLGTLMLFLHNTPSGWLERILRARPRWRDLVMPRGQRLSISDVIRSGTDFGGLRNPISRVYTRRQARALLSGLSGIEFVTEFNRFRALEEPVPLWVRSVRWMMAVVDRHWGWFLVIHGTKS